MKQLYLFYIDPSVSLDEAWEELEQVGVEMAYGSDGEEGKQLYGYLQTKQPLPPMKTILYMKPHELPPIDWEAQWATHARNYRDGTVHLDLKEFGSPDQHLLLQPGAGFGDASHATTRLVLQLMSHTVQNSFFIDIGCGSGILTLSALAMGAFYATGIDIEAAALAHSIANARLNGFENRCQFYTPSNFKLPPLAHPVTVAMNMIASEQIEALKSLAVLTTLPALWITSGIREEARAEYLVETSARNWELLEERSEEGWMSFVFRRTKP